MYFKASALHEFGERQCTNDQFGRKLQRSINYSGTWCELALGGNVQLAKNNNLYFDVTRSFGGDFQKQWQVNAGLRWSF
ncbi:MAG: autotransporter outer membrane beta-barrel domain-containing protein [Phascolarctobacterium faecium]